MDWKDRYEFAQTALLAREFVPNGTILPVWIDDSHFWYERLGESGVEYRVVDAETGETCACVTRASLAEGLACHFEAPVDPGDLIVADLRFDLKAGKLSFSAFGEAFVHVLATGQMSSASPSTDLNWLLSPDRRSALQLREANLWLVDVDAGTERPLTTDGSQFNAYGDVPAAMRAVRERLGDSAPQALWSPDGEWILTLQTDDRDVPDLPVMEYAPAAGGRPNCVSNRVSLPGDPRVTEFRILAIHAHSGRQVEARYPRLPAVRMNSTPIGAGLCWWGHDSQTAYFVDIERGEAAAHIVAFDVGKGSTRVLFSERSDTYVEVGVNVYAPALVAPVAGSSELVWYSERDGRGHLYLYDLVTGELSNPITSGAWQVREVLGVDAGRREVFFLAGGIAQDENPYVVKPCVASLDGGEIRIVSAMPGDHKLWKSGEMSLLHKKLEGLDPAEVSALSPGGRFFVETVSTIEDAPETFLRTRDGTLVTVLEQSAASLPEGWQVPEPVRCKAADGVTDTYGLLFKPLGFDPSKSYPIIDYIYGGPQLSNVPHSHFGCWTIEASRYLEGVHLSALGAFVLILDGRGTANRERDFRTTSYRAAETASNLDDHVAAIRELAEQHPQIDPDRAGITGFSAGGYMTVQAALRYGDIFKVAVGGGGNYDQSLFWHSWGERYHGEYEAAHYAAQAAKTYASGMKGRLMLVHGMMDEACHPAAMFQLVQALIEADKDPDLVLLPRAAHDWTGYGARRRWDYFARHLLGGEPCVATPFLRESDRLARRVAANSTPPSRPD